VPHLRDGFIVAKVGHFRGSENPDNLARTIPQKTALPNPEIPKQCNNLRGRKTFFFIFPSKIACQAQNRLNPSK
jgi:hypothetical protein